MLWIGVLKIVPKSASFIVQVIDFSVSQGITNINIRS